MSHGLAMRQLSGKNSAGSKQEDIGVKKNNRWKVLAGSMIGTGLVTAVWIAFCGYQWSWGPFHFLHDVKTAKLPGNAEEYGPEHLRVSGNSPLAGKQIIFLGSSVTYGSAAKGVSFADYIAVRNECRITKEAVSGTTLVESGLNSYIMRLKKLNRDISVDLFVCQLSTNDASQKKPLGEISDTFEMETFDTSTVAGALEYIIAYAKGTWECPVAFYTNPVYDSGEYAAMVDLLQAISTKWEVTVIDLWNDADFNSITDEQRRLYMADAIHPTQAGYLEWWTPYMEEVLYEVIEGE